LLIINRWEWDYIRRVVYFHHDYVYKDGKKQKENRNIMSMKLQRFNGEGIQLFDYKKMKAMERINDDFTTNKIKFLL